MKEGERGERRRKEGRGGGGGGGGRRGRRGKEGGKDLLEEVEGGRKKERRSQGWREGGGRRLGMVDSATSFYPFSLSGTYLLRHYQVSSRNYQAIDGRFRIHKPIYLVWFASI